MEKNDQLFMQLLYMFHTSAMQGLGKMADPTGEVNRNLEYVSQTIDLMEMLKDKTKGNISEDIEKVLELEERHFGALAGQGLVNIQLENYEKAIMSYKKAQEIYPAMKSPKIMIKQIKELIKKQSI